MEIKLLDIIIDRFYRNLHIDEMSDNSKLETFWDGSQKRPLRAYLNWMKGINAAPSLSNKEKYEYSFSLYLEAHCVYVQNNEPNRITWKCPDEEGEFLISKYIGGSVD